MLTLLQMTLTGGALIATLALLRAVCFDRVSKRVFRGLWLLPVARLLIPWSPGLFPQRPVPTLPAATAAAPG